MLYINTTIQFFNNSLQIIFFVSKYMLQVIVTIKDIQ